MRNVLAIIPARAGSKRIKNKNIVDFAGKPLITWTVEAAKKSKYINHVYVSTDSEIIQRVAIDAGADCHPLRSDKLSSDTAMTIDVVLDIILNIKKYYDIIIVLQPTSPLRTSKHIDEAFELYFDKKADAVISVCEADVHPSWCAPLGEKGELDQLAKNIEIARSQDLEKYYRLNGALYIINFNTVTSKKTLFPSDNIFAYKMKKADSVDIDTEEDLLLARNILMGKA